MDLITPEEMDALPEGGQAAFVELEWIVRKRIDAEIEHQDQYSTATPAKMRYVTIVCTAAEEWWIEGFGEFSGRAYTDELFDEVYQVAIRASTRISLRAKRMRGGETVELPKGAKERLRKHIADMEAALEAADLPAKKKKHLASKLADFAAELEKDRSSIRTMLAAAAVVYAVVHGAVDFTKDVEEAITKLPETVKAINLIIGREKAEEEANAPEPPRLPTPELRKALPAPAFESNLDDDVPF